MRKSFFLVFLILCSSIYAQHDQFTQIETSDLPKYFTVHSPDEGPGMDYFGSLQLCIHIKKNTPLIKTSKDDYEKISGVIKSTSSKFKPSDFVYKYLFNFKSNAPWKKEDAMVTFFQNKYLMESFNKEIKENDEYWLFIIISTYNTFDMTGYGRVVDFLSKEAMMKRGLIKK